MFDTWTAAVWFKVLGALTLACICCNLTHSDHRPKISSIGVLWGAGEYMCRTSCIDWADAGSIVL